MLHYSEKRFFRKGFDPELYEIYLVALRMVFDTECVACFHASSETGVFLWPVIANMLFVSIRKG